MKWKREHLGGNVEGWVYESPDGREAVVSREGTRWIAGVGDLSAVFYTLRDAKAWAIATLKGPA